MAITNRKCTCSTAPAVQIEVFKVCIAQAATLRVGNFRGEEAYAPFSSLLPMVHPNDIVWGGWDINGLNLADAMERAQVRRQPCLYICMRMLRLFLMPWAG